MTVDVGHLIAFNEELGQNLSEEPAEIIPLFEASITDVARRIIYLNDKDAPLDFPTCQLILKSNASLTSIRNLNADHISKLVRIAGIVIGASVLSSKASSVSLMCRHCRSTTKLDVPNGFTTLNLPPVCTAHAPEGEKKECGPKPFIVVHDKSTFIDQQTLKLQEAPDMVPVGEMPRHLLLSVDRSLTNKIVPGTRCTVIGIYSIYENKVKGANQVAIRNPYIRCVGIQTDVDHSNTSGLAIFTAQEEEEFLTMSRNPNLYEAFANSIAPSIYGNADIKKAISLLLMGGSKRILPDGMKLRGDINVLLLGDPGTAKSQLLKFVEKVSPIAIYTSGKGSSAAGLTASVQRDTITREFYLEGGAMVLADGGVVCIDEFDKMRDEDRVAIHEAMEQQTISIAKAGITTVLNSRTSVLAAANPIFGRYDDMKSTGDNIDFQTTILSRFDMIFIVKDEHNESRDRTIANHVMNVHMGTNSLEQEQAEAQAAAEIPVNKMKRYISYCRAKCAPRLTPEAAEKLSSHFVSIRKDVHDHEEDRNERSSIPITVRQLEAIVRITEALAKLQLSSVATVEHAQEAIRLFSASTMDAINQGINSSGPQKDQLEEVQKIENELRRRLPIGWSTSRDTLRKEFVENKNYDPANLEKALYILQRRETIQFRHQGRNVYRSGV